MAGSLNRVMLIGNLGADPDIKHINDKKIANLRLATSEKWRDKNSGEVREKTEWHQVCIYSEGLAGVVEQYCRKGSKVYVEGQLQTRKWQDKDGNDRWTTEVVLQQYGGQLILLGGDAPRREEGPSRAESQRNTDAQRPLDDSEVPF